MKGRGAGEEAWTGFSISANYIKGLSDERTASRDRQVLLSLLLDSLSIHFCLFARTGRGVIRSRDHTAGPDAGRAEAQTRLAFFYLHRLGQPGHPGRGVWRWRREGRSQGRRGEDPCRRSSGKRSVLQELYESWLVHIDERVWSVCVYVCMDVCEVCYSERNK